MVRRLRLKKQLNKSFRKDFQFESPSFYGIISIMNSRRKKNQTLSFHKKTKRKFNKQLFYELISWIFGIMAAVFIAFVIVMFFGIKTSMVGPSMEPVVYNGESVLINRVAYNMSSPKRGDIIVFKPNGNKNSHLYIKRVIGLPGETVQIYNGHVYINGDILSSDVAADTKEGGLATTEITLDTDEYFVLGDNRVNSEDSRSANIGNVKTSMIEGKAWYRLKFGDKKAGRIE